MNLFLDANVYLSFFHYGKDDIETMHKIVKLASDDEIALYKNNHLENEVNRNRHAKIKDGLKGFSETAFRVRAPVFLRERDDFKEMHKHLRKASEIKEEIETQLKVEINASSLAADKLVRALFDVATDIEVSPKILQAARARRELGNPPGKTGSLGDAIHWECLLAHSGIRSVDIVSGDGDFFSPLYPDKIHPSLADEWHRNFGKYSEVTMFQNLSEFFKVRYPEFDLQIETEKDRQIQSLLASTSFTETHKVVARLSEYGSFTVAQMRRMLDALMQNNQIKWIAADDDIQALFRGFISQAYRTHEDEVLRRCDAILGWEEGTLEIPF